MKKKKVKSKPKKNTYFSKIIDFILEGIGAIFMFLLEVFSNDNNGGSSTSNSNSNSNNNNNNNNSKSTGESYQPKLERFCPRCVGKGYVDDNDIKRLGRERTWQSGSCGFCRGTGYVERTDTRNPRLGTMSSSKW
jgi:hypothetical protein